MSKPDAKRTTSQQPSAAPAQEAPATSGNTPAAVVPAQAAAAPAPRQRTRIARDEFAGLGGEYTVVNGKRVRVPQADANPPVTTGENSHG